ncbi:hypothetical protein [Microbacterium sp. NIBRBAC000506063]
MIAGVQAYADEVRAGAYPEAAHTYSMPAEEAARLQELLEGR